MTKSKWKKPHLFHSSLLISMPFIQWIFNKHLLNKWCLSLWNINILKSLKIFKCVLPKGCVCIYIYMQRLCQSNVDKTQTMKHFSSLRALIPLQQHNLMRPLLQTREDTYEHAGWGGIWVVHGPETWALWIKLTGIFNCFSFQTPRSHMPI